MKILVVTSYLSRVRELHYEGFTCFCIARFPPSWWKGRCLRAFAPSEALLRRLYEASLAGNKLDYFHEYLWELKNNPEGVGAALQDIRRAAAANENKQIALLCFEKNHTQCHRTVLAEYLRGRTDTQDFEGWEEWKPEQKGGMLGDGR